MELPPGVGGGFCTLLWPYAYIGLEVKQSLALLLAGYLGLMNDGKATWSRVLLFALSCAVAVSVKASGTFLVPAILFLVGCYYWRYSFRENASPSAQTGGNFGNHPGSIFFELGPAFPLLLSAMGAKVSSSRLWLVSGPTAFLLQVVGYFGSPNKGMFVYAPIVLLSFLAFPRFSKGASGPGYLCASGPRWPGKRPCTTEGSIRMRLGAAISSRRNCTSSPVHRCNTRTSSFTDRRSGPGPGSTGVLGVIPRRVLLVRRAATSGERSLHSQPLRQCKGTSFGIRFCSTSACFRIICMVDRGFGRLAIPGGPRNRLMPRR